MIDEGLASMIDETLHRRSKLCLSGEGVLETRM
jgi:hypothetical protein